MTKTSVVFFSTLLVLFLALSAIFPIYTYASYQSDYEYQTTRYRTTFAEFQVFKSDYISNPTLDNLQKALISARQSIKARNLGLMSFTGLTYENLLISRIDKLEPVKSRLVVTYNYYQQEANKADSLVQLTDFTSMSASFRNANDYHMRSLRYGQVSYKLITLLDFNAQLQSSYDNLVLRLPDNLSNLVTQRVSEIRTRLDQSRLAIETDIESVIPEFEIDQDILIPSNLAKWASKLSSIRQTHIQIADQIIDLEKNYARNN
jgi:hypothetical protein